MGDIGQVAELLQVIFKWVTEPGGYTELTLARKLDKLHEGSLRALAAKDFVACDTLLAEYRRLSAQII